MSTEETSYADLLAATNYNITELRAWNEWGGMSTTSGQKISPETALQVSSFCACVRVIAESCSSLPLFLYRRLTGGGKEKALDQPLNRLLHQQPNPWQTAMEFREMQTALYLMYGNSYAEIRPGTLGAVSELWPLHPSRMDVDRAADGSLRYRYREPGGTKTTYSQDQIFHLRWLSTDGVLGLQPAQLSRNAIGLAQALETHGSKFFENGARPGGILESDHPVPPEASANMRQQFESIHRGADRSHRIALLPAGIHYKEIGGANESAQFLQSRAFQVVEMCRIFRMPPHMIQHLDKSTFSNIQTQSTEFVQYCLLPHLKRWESAISRDLIVDDEQYFAEHSVSGLMRGDSSERASFYREMLNLGVMTINECRDLENLNPIGPAGDHRLMQMNLTTLENIIATPAPAPPSAPAPATVSTPDTLTDSTPETIE